MVEANPPPNVSDDFGALATILHQMADIIKSPVVKNTDIMALAEDVFNRLPTAILLRTSTLFCDGVDAL